MIDNTVFLRFRHHVLNLIPELTQHLNPETDLHEVISLTEKYGTKMPRELVELLSHINGFKGEFWSGLYLGFEPLTAHDAVAHTVGLMQTIQRPEYTRENLQSGKSNPRDEANLDFFSKEYFVFAYDGSRGYLALDYSPGPKGHAGQVITVGQVQGTRHVLSNNLYSFINVLNEGVESGLMEYSTDVGLHFKHYKESDLVFGLDHNLLSIDLFRK